ncbi:hypothetical protein ACH4E7_43660 [Kitasatospora sp. NPDC018058]|uniref:hypothetical protein n=1 Tax=Kitasatospora sp. NPDC018058 TaxID=3364025 RepID=UPI0037C139FD
MTAPPAGAEDDHPPRHLFVGRVHTAQRTVSCEDIAAFGSLVGDHGRHHRPGAEGVMAHGLFTASLATQVGGRLDFIARTMSWEFLQPVWAGDTITANVVVRALEARNTGTAVEFDITIVNQRGTTVLRGSSSGLIRS